MSILGALGSKTLSRVYYANYLASVIFTVLRLCLTPWAFPRSVRNVLARQILFTGVEAVHFISIVAFMVGISVVAQAQIWLSRFGQSNLLGDLLVLIIIREAAPLLTNLVVIGRSGTAIATELGHMKISGETRLLDAQGIDPFIYLVVPRVLGVMFSVFFLTIIFIVVSFTSGYITGILLDPKTGQPAIFIKSVFEALQVKGVVNVTAKTFIPGLLTGAICCIEGFSVKNAVTEVPQATTRALVRSVLALFGTSALISVLTYL